MADLFGLLQDLGERIASKGDSSSGTQLDDEEDPVEARFRSVLPNLLRTYFVPAKVKEREFTAILKLLCHTAKNFPGVFYRGKASAVLPVFGQLFPFFAEPACSTRFGVLLEAIGSLVTLLKNGDRVVYRHLFEGAMLLVQDLVSVASFFEFAKPFANNTAICVKCFIGAFSMVTMENKQSFCDLPSHWRAEDGSGLFLDVTGKACWQSLAECALKLLGRMLIEGLLHVEGLISSTFLYSLGCLICFGDSSLQKTAFEFLHKVIPVVDVELVPGEKLLLTITSILSLDDEKAKLFRNAAYDTALASCLSSLCTTLQRETLEASSRSIMDVFYPTIWNTPSNELKITMCLAFENIVKFCPPEVWKLDEFLQLIFITDIRSHICKCLEYALDALGIVHLSTNAAYSDTEEEERPSSALRKEVLKLSESSKRKRKSEAYLHDTAKYQRVEQGGSFSNEPVVLKRPSSTTYLTPSKKAYMKLFDVRSVFEEQKSATAGIVHAHLMRTIRMLDPASFPLTFVDLDGVFSAFHVLVNVFYNQQSTVYYKQLTQKSKLWILWVIGKAKEGTLAVSQLCVFLDALEKLFCGIGAESMSYQEEISKELSELLAIPWSLNFTAHNDDLQKAKCSALTISSTVKLDNLDLHWLHSFAVKDEDATVRSKAGLLLVVVAALSGVEAQKELFELLGVFSLDHSSQVRECVAQAFGQMACISKRKNIQLPSCKMKVMKDLKPSMEGRSQACPGCGTLDVIHHEEADGSLSVEVCKSFFTQLFFEEERLQVQLSFVRSMPYLLAHASQRDLSQLKNEWMKCLDSLLLHSHKDLRRCFAIQVPYFFCHHVLEGLFANDEACGDNGTGELQILGKLKQALSITEDPDVLESLLETVLTIVMSASNRQQLFFFSFVLLLEQLDSKFVSVQAASVHLLQKSISLLSKKEHSISVPLMYKAIQPELFVYFSGRLVSRPVIVRNFADAVLGIQTGDLIRQIVPIVLPKLVVEQQHSDDALHILDALSQQLGTELPLLLLEWCHKVLSVLLLKADGKDLMAALQFYEAQTGSDTREILSAVLPALLDELIQFMGDTSTEDATRR